MHRDNLLGNLLLIGILLLLLAGLRNVRGESDSPAHYPLLRVAHMPANPRKLCSLLS